MTQLVWCIEHDHSVQLTTDLDGELCHDFPDYFEGKLMWEQCCFPKGFVPAHIWDMSDDWMSALTEPSPEELAVMNENAEDLVYELGLV